MIEGDARWIAYLVFALFVLIQLWWRRAQLPDRLTIGGLWLFIFATSTVFSFGSLINRWLGLGHEGSMYVGQEFDPVRPQIAIASLLIVLASLTSSRQQFVSKELMLITFISALTLAALMNTRLGDLVVGYRGHNLVLYFIVLVLIAKEIWSDTNSPFFPALQSQGFQYLSWAFLLSVHVLLSLRVDGLTVPGAWFHVGYFSGVVQTIQNGGLMLWDTPSQYGVLNMILAALMPGRSGLDAFLRFQALLLILVGLVVLVAIRLATGQRRWIIFGGIFLLMFHFADPALIGPQPFPSSSVMRFGPSLALLAMLSMVTRYGRKYLVVVVIAASIGLLWSFESFFYCSLVLLGWFVGRDRQFDRVHQTVAQAKFLMLGIATASGLIVVSYSLFALLRVGSLPDWSLFYLAASKFAEGFGGLPTDPWGALMVLLVGIWVNVTLVGVADSKQRPICSASAGALLGWITYYVGRSHSSNIIAIFPLIFVAIVLPSLHLAQLHLPRVSATPKDKNLIEQEKLSATRISIGTVAVIASVLTATFVANPALPGLVSNFRVLPQRPIYESSVVAGDSLLNLLRSIDIKPLPMAYVGNLGLLPPLPDDLVKNELQSLTWLPQPLGLLEEPIPSAKRRQLLSRFIERNPRDGYLIWHKSNSIPGRFEEWIADLAQTHDCKSVIENDDWQIRECTLRVR